MLRLIWLVVFLPILVGEACGEELSFEAGNAAFEKGDFAKAAKIYEELIERDGPSAALLYNLGNSEASAGETGRAILFYERARLLAPRDPDLRANLALVRNNAAIFESERYHPWVAAAMAYLSRDEWSWVVVVGAWYGGGILLWMCLRQGGGVWRWWSFGVAGVMVLLGLGVLWLRQDESGRGIVIAKEAVVRISPFEKAEAIGTLSGGRAAQVGKKSGDFFFVVIPGTELEGWLHREEVELIEGAGWKVQ